MNASKSLRGILISAAIIVAPSVMNSAMADGKATYAGACFACHSTGAAGAPKLGDKDAWKERIAKGTDVLYTSAISGIGIMPAKGGNSNLSDDDVKGAVDYMVEQSQ